VDVSGLKATIHITGAHLIDLLQVDAPGGNEAVTVAACAGAPFRGPGHVGHDLGRGTTCWTAHALPSGSWK